MRPFLKCVGYIISIVSLLALVMPASVGAQDKNVVAGFPAPPAQSRPWAAPTNLPASLATTVDFLFRTGMADPRGCEYREIELMAGNVWKSSAVPVKTHGWVLPLTKSAGTNFAIGWNGLIYSVSSIGAPADALKDANAMIDAMDGHDLSNQIWSDEEYQLQMQWLTPVKAALIVRFGSSELSRKCTRLIGTNDCFLLFATDRLWVAFDRAVCAHMRGDDDLAYNALLSVTEARQRCESEAQSRGLQTEQSPEGKYRREQRGGRLDSYFPFLDSVPALLRDQERRHHRNTPLRNPVAAKTSADRIAALIDQFENICVEGKDPYDLTANPVVSGLIQEGWDAVEPLIACYEHDQRLTRMVPVSHGGSGAWSSRADRVIVPVREPAYVALENILETAEFAPEFSGKETEEEKAAIYSRAAGAMREYWNKYRGLSREERLYAILKDDHGHWLQAATILVQATNDPVVLLHPFSYWSAVPWTLPLNLYDNSPMKGERLRSKLNPSVSELIARRVQELANAKPGEDDASSVNEACNLTFCLARWDRPAGVRQAELLSPLCFRILSPANYSSLSSHMTLSGQLPALIILRAKSGDTNALRDYASWITSIDPEKFFWQPGQILSPLPQFSDDAAFKPVWQFIFNDEQSAWFRFLWKFNVPDPKRWSSSRFCAEEFFGTPAINNEAFRAFVIRLLHQTSPCGKILGERGNYWLDQSLSTNRRFGYTVQAPDATTELNDLPFRTCDFYAWLLGNRVQGAPEFQLYWPEARRDEAINELEKLLQRRDNPLKSQPFQEP